MVLEQLKDGAQRQLQVFDEGTRQLTLLLCLPLIDGVFATLLVTGAVQNLTDYLLIALTVFSGAGSLAVLYSYAESIEEAKSMVLKAAPVLVVGASLIGLVAPVYDQLFSSQTLSYTAALVLMVIAGKLAEIDPAEKVSTTTVLVTGLVLSLQSPGALTLSLGYLAPAALTALTATFFLYVATYLTNMDMELGYIRKGSALVVILIGLSVAGLSIPSELGLVVFGVSLMASLA
ncbi:DUF5794 domain-containing protein [Candidatus Nanohalococcus occultus]|uniref:Membrane protein n=1 Tax=Candidatus Nanohalococcus occultus TaxID=2978047 RepID=A0ABY8CCV6_9ARCH|nr:putative membrane protein [Candidatus Nanohaloarchaeota archaeon SVXNc]